MQDLLHPPASAFLSPITDALFAKFLSRLFFAKKNLGEKHAAKKERARH